MCIEQRKLAIQAHKPIRHIRTLYQRTFNDISDKSYPNFALVWRKVEQVLERDSGERTQHKTMLCNGG